MRRRRGASRRGRQRVRTGGAFGKRSAHGVEEEETVGLRGGHPGVQQRCQHGIGSGVVGCVGGEDCPEYLCPGPVRRGLRSGQAPQATGTPRSRTSSARLPTSRLLPMPGSPVTSSRHPRPLPRTSPTARRNRASSLSRPTMACRSSTPISLRRGQLYLHFAPETTMG